MHQLWQNPQLRILLIMNLIGMGILLIFIAVALFIFVYNRWNKKHLYAQNLEKFDKFFKRLRDRGVPSEISSAFDELREGMIILEESTAEQVNTFFALVKGLEEKIKLIQNSTDITEKKMVAVLQSIVARLKKSNREMVDKHAQNLFKKLNRLEEEEIKGLEERLIIIETFIEAMQLLNGSPEIEDIDNK